MGLCRLFDPVNQFETRNSMLNVAGQLKVFLDNTDDYAQCYDDNGSIMAQPVILDADGRAPGLFVDAEQLYRLEVYDRYGMLLWTVRHMVPSASGSPGGSGVVDIVSTDGSVSVTRSEDAGVVSYDLSVAPIPDEPLDWIKASVSNIPEGTVAPSYDEGTMYTTVDGISVTAGRFYHTTTWLKVLPAGDGISYETLSVEMRLNGNTLWVRTFDIDNSVNDPVPLEISYDLDCQEDGYVDFEVTGVSSLSSVDLSTQFHRIFNGYSSEYAKKTWVSNSFVNNAYLNIQSGTITGISGTPIGGISEAQVSSIASSYAESAASSKLDTSAFTNYTASALTGIMQDTAAISSSVSSLETSKVDQSAFDACCSAVEAQVSSLSSDVSAIQQDTGAISAAVSGLTGTYIQYADLESADGKITGISGTALWGGHEYTGIWPIVVDNTADKISAANKTLAVDETMTGYASGDSAVIGVNTSTVLSGLSAYQLTADMSGYQPSGDYAYNSSLGDYQPVSGMTAYQPSGDYAYNSAVSSKAEQSSLTAYQEITGMSAYQLSGDYAYNSSLSDYQPVSGMSAYQPSGDYAYNSAVSGKQDASAMTAYQLSGDYAYNSSLSDYQPVSGMTAYQPSGNYLVPDDITGKADVSSLTAYQEITGMSAYQLSGDYAYNSAVSGKADSSALTAYQEISGMTAYQPVGDYQPSGDYAYNSSVSGKQDASGMSAYALSADVSGCIDTVSTNSASWGAGVSLPITGTNGIESATYADSYVELQRYDTAGEPDIRTAQLTPDQLSLSYTIDENDYYSMTLTETSLGFDNPEGYTEVTPYSIQNWDSAVDTVSNNSATWEGVTAKQDASAMSAYQEVSGMTAYQPAGNYQPSGDYIYVSALGWAEV